MFLVIATLISAVGLAYGRHAYLTPSAVNAMAPTHLFAVAFGLYFGVGGILSYPLDSYYLLTGLTKSGYGFAAAYALIALLCFLSASTLVQRSERIPMSGTFAQVWPEHAAGRLAGVLLVALWSIRIWLASSGLVIKGTFTIFEAPSVWARIGIVGSYHLQFPLSILLGIASTKSRFWTAVAVLATAGELAFGTVTINRREVVVFVLLVMAARWLVQSNLNRWQPRARTLGLLLPAVAAVFFVGQAVRNAMYKDFRAFIDRDTPRIASEVWEFVKKPEMPKGEETFYANRLNPYDLLASVVVAIDGEAIAPLKGRTFALYAPGVVPRILWPKKPDPEMTDKNYIQQAYDIPLKDTLGTPLAELYANFGLLGVTVGYTILGLWYGTLYRLLFRRRHTFSEWHVVTYLLLVIPLCWMENSIAYTYAPEYRNDLIFLAILWILIVGYRQMARIAHPLRPTTHHRNGPSVSDH